MVRPKSVRETTNMSTAEATIEEAQRHVRRLVEFEKGRCGGDTDVALFRATSVWGVEEGSVRSLWKRKTLTYVKAHIMDRLRQIDDVLEEYANRQRKALEETAQVLEERGSRAAGLARFAAQMAREEAEG